MALIEFLPAAQRWFHFKKPYPSARVLFDNKATPAVGTLQVTETVAGAVSGHADMTEDNYGGLSISWPVKDTCTAVYFVPQFSVDGVNWDDDTDIRDPLVPIPLKIKFTAATVIADLRRGFVLRGSEVPYNFIRCRVWADGVVGNDRVVIEVAPARR